MTPTFEHIIFDIETNGLLPEQVQPPFCMDRIHSLVIMDIPTRTKISFINDDLFNVTGEEQQIALENAMLEIEDLGHATPGYLSEGIAMIERAKTIVGHNIIDFDIPAIEMCFPDFDPRGRIIDTLVMARMCFADVKEKDFRMAAKGQLEGRLIGLQGLEAWGQRLGLAKGDYKKDREAELKAIHKEEGYDPPTDEELHAYVWGVWNVAMHDYMMLDADVNEKLWTKIEAMHWSPEATRMEHEIHALMVQQERNGFYFNRAGGEALGQHLQDEYDRFAEKAIEEIGRWYRPSRWHDEESVNEEHGEDDSRRAWGDVTIPKRTMNFAKANAKLDGDYTRLRAGTLEGVPYVKVELRDFNPNSRPQIVDRLKHLYGWTPQDFTENGTARVDDEILRNLEDDIPLAKTLAEIFYYKKRIGMVVDGKNGWLKLCGPDSRIHGRVNVGGTVSGRATHAAPNVSQVPGVEPVEIKGDREKFDAKVAQYKADGLLIKSKWKDAKNEGAIYVYGRDGKHGWDCRELFTVPEGYKLVGCDLSGIEFRCLANLTYEFDDGELVDVVLNGDIHQKNADLAGIGRGVAKRLLYACVPMDTQALTREGWKTYDQLVEGEDILTYNAKTGVKEWKPLLEKVYYEDAPVVRMHNKGGFDVRSTPNHRWYSRRRVDHGTAGRAYETVVKTTETLTTEDAIITNAPMFDEQSSMPHMIHTEVPKYGTDWVQHVIDMSSLERRAFLAGFCIADGYWHEKDGRKGSWRWSQNIGPLSEAALMASYLEWGGYLPTNVRTDTPNPMILARQNQNSVVTMQRMEREYVGNEPVWCVRTENETWVMRQGNTITITGNTMYGGGDAKLGSIVEPLASEGRQRSLGKQLRAKLMAAMPSLQQAIKAIHREARMNGGTIRGLDGRRLYVRSKHAALNLRLQSDGAMIAKKWCLLTDDMFYDEGWTHHINAEYAFCSWSHDEIQVAVREDLAERAAEIMEAAAPLAGDHFSFRCPVAAESQIGMNWAETH